MLLRDILGNVQMLIASGINIDIIRGCAERRRSIMIMIGQAASIDGNKSATRTASVYEYSFKLECSSSAYVIYPFSWRLISFTMT